MPTNPSKVLLFIAIAVSISACNKSDKWTSSALLQTKTYNSMAVDAIYDITGAKGDVEIGICWDDEANPNLDDESVTQIISQNSTIDYQIENLYANTTYYFRPFIYQDNGTALLYGEEISITNDPIPAFDNCTITTGEVDNEGTIYLVDDLQDILLPDFYKLSMSDSNFDFNFHFKEEPKSGIYLQDSSPQFLQDFQYYMSVQVLDGGSNCTYYSAVGQPIHVNNVDGEITLSFCQLEISTTGSCAQTLLFSGEMILN